MKTTKVRRESRSIQEKIRSKGIILCAPRGQAIPKGSKIHNNEPRKVATTRL